MIPTLLSHRTIRQFTSDPVPDEHVRQAVEVGQRASTSSAIQAYALIDVTRPDERARLVEFTGGQAQVAEAGRFFVVCGDTRRHRLAVEAGGGTYAARLEAFLLAVVDASLFAEKMVIAFEAMGYGICYIGGLRNQLAEVNALLEIPEGVYPLYGLCVGVPAAGAADGPARPRLEPEAVWHQDRYPSDAAVMSDLAAYDAVYRSYLEARGASVIRGWSEVMGEKFAAVRRPDVGAFYRSKGADLS